MLRSELVNHLNLYLDSSKYQDYCPNGLQVEGTNTINNIVTGVSLSAALIDYAVTKKAQAIIVHHGIFWHKSDYALTGLKYRRIAKLIKNDINLIAYHLPLDNHPETGNNIQLAKLLNINATSQSGYQNLLWSGDLLKPINLMSFVEFYQKQTGHLPIYFGDNKKIITKVAWCTGGADSMFEEAINLGVDCFITGEIKEPIMNLALESGLAFIVGGHYVTERYGILALTEYLKTLGLNVEYKELYNPI